MKISQTLHERIPLLLAADDSSLGPASSPCKVALIDADFTPSVDLVAADIHQCAVSGLVPLAAVTGDQVYARDPVTGEWIVRMKPPAGGWRWVQDNGVGLPAVIYGFALTNNAGTTVLGSQKFDDPIHITAAGQEIVIGDVTFRLDPAQIN